MTTKPMLLIVEDAKGQADLMRWVLRDHYEFCSVCSLEGAVNILQAMQFAAILLDLNLPDSRGLDTFEDIYAATQAPIVVISGIDNDALAKTIREAGGRYLKKPYEVKKLIAEIAEALKGTV